MGEHGRHTFQRVIFGYLDMGELKYRPCYINHGHTTTIKQHNLEPVLFLPVGKQKNQMLTPTLEA